ncbi:ArnT family glycosyltransferase [Candidatus Leptofilum sp.]|uniref:ArnT family glycosyltransferase n=1 Tax=Candidatus Leptofilum sp. TaxID=3241576 RepID=UPI003B5C05A6
MFSRLLRALSRHTGILVPATTILVFILIGGAYQQQTPLLETPDEPSHFAVANYIAQNGSLPPRPIETRTGPAPTVSDDVPFYYAPPLYYWLASWLIDPAETAEFARSVVPNPNFERGIGINLGAGADNKNMYVHTAAQTPPNLASWAVSMRRVRLFSLLLGSLTVLGGWALAQQLWPNSWRWQATAVSLILFNPTFLYVSNGVTNDPLLIAVSSWSFVLMGSLLLQPGYAKIGWREWLLALLLGCAILTKQTGFILLPPALLVMLHKAQRQQWAPGRLLTVLGAGALVITAVGGWWYLYNSITYGDPLALESHNALPPIGNMAEHLQFTLAQNWGAFKSYWAAFGWATIFVEPVWYAYFMGLTGLGITGWLWKRPSRKRHQLLWLPVLLNGGLLLVWLWRTAAPYGRLLFPAIVPTSCLLVLGWQQWLARLRWPAAVGQLGIAVPLAVLAIASPTRYLQPAFAPVTLAATETGEFVPLNAIFGSQFHLLGYTLSPPTMQAGDTVELTLMWQLAAPSAAPNQIEAVVQVAPLNPEAQVAAASQLLGSSRYPAPFWQAVETIRQTYQIALTTDTPAPSLYWFDLVLLDEASQSRLPIVWQERPLSEALLRIGPVPIYAQEAGFLQETAVATPAIATEYNFNEQIRLNGYTIEPATNEVGLKLTLFWESLAEPAADWTVFVHLVDENGELAVQGDGLPRNGNFPTSWWATDIIVPDTHWLVGDFTCANLADYQLLVGFYNPETAVRLPVSDAAGQPIPNMAVELQPTCAESDS